MLTSGHCSVGRRPALSRSARFALTLASVVVCGGGGLCQQSGQAEYCGVGGGLLVGEGDVDCRRGRGELE